MMIETRRIKLDHNGGSDLKNLVGNHSFRTLIYLALLNLLVVPLAAVAQAQRSESVTSASSARATTTVKIDPSAGPRRLTRRERLRMYRRSTYGPGSFARTGAGALYGQAISSPYKWGGGFKGYGRRFASGYAGNIISGTISFGVAALDHEYPHYIRSTDRSASARVRHALLSTVVSPRDRGGKMPAYSHFAGAYGAGLASTLWRPAAGVGTGIVSGTATLGASAGLNVLREFGPDIKRHLHHKRRPPV